MKTSILSHPGPRLVSWLLLSGCVLSFLSIEAGRAARRRKILFLCTGNYYRSRMAEEIFNHAAQQSGLPYKAVSKALAARLDAFSNVGPIAQPAVSILESSGIQARSKRRWPQTVTARDFETANLVVALNLPEHQPMVLKRFPQYAGRVIYWNIPDIGEMRIEEAFRLLQSNIRDLIASLENQPLEEF